jgi:hypothetical protein
MSIECDQTCAIAAEHDQTDLEPTVELPAMTPETARRLAAILAPHLVAMRAVTAGTRYAGCGRDEARGDGVSAQQEPPVSPATKIFIAGMLERIPA